MKSTNLVANVNAGLGSNVVPNPPVSLLFLPENQDLFHASLGIKYEVPSPEPTDSHDLHFVYETTDDYNVAEQLNEQALPDDVVIDWEKSLHEMTVVVAEERQQDEVTVIQSSPSTSEQSSEKIDSVSEILPSPVVSENHEDSIPTSNSVVSREFKFVAVGDDEGVEAAAANGEKTNVTCDENAERIKEATAIMNLVLPTDLQLSLHWQLIKGMYRCMMCSKTTSNEKNIERHILRIHMNIKPFSCSICHQGFCSLRALSEHTNRVHNPSALDLRYKCKVCGKQYANEYKYKLHQNVHERKIQFRCHDCGKGFFYKHNIQVHIMGRHLKAEDMTLHICELCGKHFKSSGALRTHRTSVHRTGTLHECRICNRLFTFQNRLQQHMTQHTGERAYTCDICSKSFRIRESLRRHLQTHYDPKPHKCAICGACYAQRDTLEEHTLKHDGIRKYSCSECGKTFAQKSHLAAHKFVHREKSFVCTICGAKFNRNDNMKTHMKRHFKDGDVKKENGVKNGKKTNGVNSNANVNGHKKKVALQKS